MPFSDVQLRDVLRSYGAKQTKMYCTPSEADLSLTAGNERAACQTDCCEITNFSIIVQRVDLPTLKLTLGHDEARLGISGSHCSQYLDVLPERGHQSH